MQLQNTDHRYRGLRGCIGLHVIDALLTVGLCFLRRSNHRIGRRRRDQTSSLQVELLSGLSSDVLPRWEVLIGHQTRMPVDPTSTAVARRFNGEGRYGYTP